MAVVALQPRPDAVALEQAARVARVLAEDESASASSRSTRRVTSSRLPIGVAHTASGIGQPRPSASNASRQAPIRPVLGTELGADDADRERVHHGLAAGDLGRRRCDELERRDPKAAADDHELGREGVHPRADCGAEQVPHPGERLERAGSPLRTPDEELRVRAFAPELLGGAVGGVPGRDRLDVAAPGAVSLAGRPVGDDDDMPELGDAAVERAAEDESAADTGAEREDDQVVDAAARAELPSASAATLPSFSTTAGRPKRSWTRSASETSRSGMLTEPSAFLVLRSMTDVIPNPIAACSSASGSIAAAIPSRSASCDSSIGVGTSCRSCSVPSASTDPVAIFVPPRSTPMTRWGATGRGYHTRPDGGRREALPALQGRPHEGEGADRAASGASGARSGAPPSPRGDRAGGAGIGLAALALGVSSSSCGSSRATSLPQGRRAGERAAPAHRGGEPRGPGRPASARSRR